MTAKEELKKLISERAYQKVEAVQLASGKTSNAYFDMKRVALHAPSLKVLSRALLDSLQDVSNEVNWVAGVSVGGDPIVTGLILAADDSSLSWHGLLVRKKPKDHGLSQGRAVDGLPSDGLGGGWLVEDVVSSGASSMTAAKMMLNEGYVLKGVICVVDREMGGVDSLSSELGVPVRALFRASEFE